jgi:signal transduction histidine kinase
MGPAEQRPREVPRDADWYRFLFEQAAHAWLVVQLEKWQVVEASAEAARLLDIPLEQLCSMPLPGFRRLAKLLEREGAHGVVRADVTLALPNGRTQTVDAQARRIVYNGDAYLWVLLLDSTDERGVAERLVVTDRLALLGQLLVGIAHEIRNPLAAIQLNLHVLQQSTADSPECQAAVELALAGTQRIAELVETTLNFARPTAQFVHIHTLQEVVNAALRLFQTMLYRKNIDIRLHYSPDTPPVVGDMRQLQQVFINLLSNAVDAIQEHGTITIRTEREEIDTGTYAVVSIEDTGVGIPPEDLPRIFEPFFTRKPHGTGLGLAIARRIVLQHRGELLVHSTPGVGTRCVVRLPAAERTQ